MMIKWIEAFVATPRAVSTICAAAARALSGCHRRPPRGLAALDDDDLCNLSDIGRKMRREEREAFRRAYD